MDFGLGQGLAQIEEKLRDSLKELAERGNKLTDLENELKDGHQKLDGEKELLEVEKQKIAEKEGELEEEKKLMQKYEVDEDDVIELNVQGQIMATLRKTLTQVPNTFLSGIFSGRWESKIHRDKEGRVFLDFIPSIFRLLLDYLTALRLSSSPKDVSLPCISGKTARDFRVMVHNLGLEEALFGSAKCFSPTLKSSSIMLGEENMCAMSNADGMGFVLGEGVYRNEVVEFVLQVERLEEPWIFIGILEDAGMPAQDNSFNGNPGAYGWAGLGGVWSAGEKLQGCPMIPAALLGPGLRVRLWLDCREEYDSHLTLAVESDGSQYRIPHIPKGKGWRLHINMVGIGDKLELVEVVQHNR